MITTIIQNVILPITLLIATGFILNRCFRLDMNTLSKLLFYFFIPALTFVKIYEAKTSVGMLLTLFGFLVVQFASLYLLSALLNRVLKHSKTMGTAFSNSVVLTNNGNVGIPVNDLAFHHNPFAMSIQMVIVLFEILAVFTYGVFITSSVKLGFRSTLVRFLKMPVFYCMLAGLVCNVYQFAPPDFIWIPMNTAADGMLSLALVAIGAQIASAGFLRNWTTVLLSNVLRLIVSPCVAYLLIQLFGLDGIIAQTLFIASAMPTSRNSAALALEYHNEPEYAAQAVLACTLLSSITLTITVFLSPILFP